MGAELAVVDQLVIPNVVSELEYVVSAVQGPRHFLYPSSPLHLSRGTEHLCFCLL